jgi:hypothetical protein
METFHHTFISVAKTRDCTSDPFSCSYRTMYCQQYQTLTKLTQGRNVKHTQSQVSTLLSEV